MVSSPDQPTENMVTGFASYGHGGNVHAVSKTKGLALDSILDFSANINPLGPPEWLRPCLSREMDSILHYPDPSASELAGVISERYDVPRKLSWLPTAPLNSSISCPVSLAVRGRSSPFHVILITSR